MKTKIGKHTIELADGIDTLSVRRYQVYTRMLLVDAGIGSDLAAFDTHLQKVQAFIRKGDADNAVKELENTRHNVYMMQEGINPTMLAFAALVTAVDGKPTDDLTDEGLRAVAAQLQDAPIKAVTELAATAKKKIDDEFEAYFPKLADSSTEKEYYLLLKRRAMAQIEGMRSGDMSEADRLTNEMLTFAKPKSFSGAENVEIQHDKNFEKMCIAICKETNANPKNMTVKEFFSAYEYVKEITEKAKKNGRS